MRTGFVGRAIRAALVAFAMTAVSAAGPMDGMGEKIARTVQSAVAEATKSPAAEDEAANTPAPGAGEAVLKFGGTDGTRFSGTCTVGDEEREISGEAPQSYTFALDGRGLECEIRKQDPGDTLKIVFAAEGTRSVQRVGGGESTVNLSYENGSVSSTTSSSSVISW